jgi:uncharacterized protein (DUF433 family)
VSLLLIIMDNLITSSKNVPGGTPVFSGTRVPFQALIDYLEAGDSIDTFLDDFPRVSREQVITTLERAKEHLLEAQLSTWKSFWMNASRDESPRTYLIMYRRFVN